MNKTFSVSIVDDSPDLREQIANYLNLTSEFCCENNYSNSIEALKCLPKEPTDIVLMDINLGSHGVNGIECVRRLKMLMPVARIIMLTVFDDSEKIFQALSAGASGYLLKRMPPQQLVEAMREVMSGGAPMSPPIALKVVQFFQSASKGNNAAELSPREYEVLNALAEGLADKQIATKLDVSYFTIRNHIRRIYEKLHVQSRTEAVAKFYKNET